VVLSAVDPLQQDRRDLPRSRRSELLQLDALHKRYGSVVALDGCSLAVPSGRVVGFVGPNGSGKTTAMRGIFGLAVLDSGTTTWHGQEITPGHRLRFGYMPEQRGLYPKMPVREQLIYFARLHGMLPGDARSSADTWLTRLGIADRARSNLEELSHGNQQRVQLAAALVHRPDLIVLDEPFSGLDPVAVQVLAEVIRDEARRGAAVVFSSHQLDLVQDICEDVAIIHRGRVLLSGPLQELREQSPVRFVEIGTHGVPLASWLPPIEGLDVVESSDDHAILRVPRDIEVEHLLEAVSRAGSVRYFRFEPPSLTRLFLETVRR
jgi:ABC-2 type transport system ATP-binding protein